MSCTQTVFRSVEEETKRRNNHTHDERKQELINITTESSFSSLQFDLEGSFFSSLIYANLMQKWSEMDVVIQI